LILRNLSQQVVQFNWVYFYDWVQINSIHCWESGLFYQILYSEVSDHLSEYATLKAMGVYLQTYLLLEFFKVVFNLA